MHFLEKFVSRQTTAGEVLCLETVHSTNEVAAGLASALCPSFTTVFADRQVTGKAGRPSGWISEPGNIHASIVLRANEYDGNFNQLMALLACSVCDIIEPFIDGNSKIRVKWPNDILINEKKVCGILLEVGPGREDVEGDKFDFAPHWWVCGFGLNVQEVPSELSDQATCLSDHWLETKSCVDITALVVARFKQVIQTFGENGFSECLKAVSSRFESSREAVSFKIGDTQLAGRVIEFLSDGDVLVEVSDGRRLPRMQLVRDTLL